MRNANAGLKKVLLHENNLNCPVIREHICLSSACVQCRYVAIIVIKRLMFEASKCQAEFRDPLKYVSACRACVVYICKCDV